MRWSSRLLVAVVFSIAFAYIESAVVAYLRVIFYPDGFIFPVKPLESAPDGPRLVLTEMGREAATLTLIFTGAWLFGQNRRQRLAYFMVIFAIWDIFYYVWLKVLLDWPGSIMDWDLLFLIPVPWASAVLCPVLVSAALFGYAVTMLYMDAKGKAVSIRRPEIVWMLAGAILTAVAFCIAGLHAGKAGYREHFPWLAFAGGFTLMIAGFGISIAAALRTSAVTDGPAAVGPAPK